MSRFCIYPALALMAILTIAANGSLLAAVDPVASYLGPFEGASNFDEIVQEFEISDSGLLISLAAHVPTMPSQIDTYEFAWELLDAAGFDDKLINIDELPVIFSGAAWSDTTTLDDPWDAAPVPLAADLDFPVTAGQRFMLLIRIDNSVQWTAMWISGAASLPGEAYQRKYMRYIGPWQHVLGTEFGRLVEVDPAVSTAEQTWSAVKKLYH